MSNQSNRNKTDKFGVMLLALVSLLSVGFGFYAEKNQFPLEEVSPQVQLRRSLEKSIAATYPQINDPQLSAWEKVNLLRRWAYQQTDVPLKQQCLFDNQDLRTKTAAEILSGFQQDKAGVWCGGSAIFLMKLYEQYGFKAYALNMGKPSVSQSFTHVLVLVKIPHNGEEKLVVQDGYFNTTYTHLDGSPLDYFELISFLKNRQEDKIKVVQNQDGFREILLCQNRVELQIREFSTRNLDCQEVGGQSGYKCLDTMTFESYYNRYKSVQQQIRDFFSTEALPASFIFLFLYPMGIESSHEDASAILQQAQLLAQKQPDKPQAFNP